MRSWTAFSLACRTFKRDSLSCLEYSLHIAAMSCIAQKLWFGSIWLQHDSHLLLDVYLPFPSFVIFAYLGLLCLKQLQLLNVEFLWSTATVRGSSNRYDKRSVCKTAHRRLHHLHALQQSMPFVETKQQRSNTECDQMVRVFEQKIRMHLFSRH